MGLQIPVPILLSGKVYKNVEIKGIESGVIADTQDVISKGDIYSAMKTFLSGSLKSIEDKTSSFDIKNLVGHMPYISAIFLAIKILVQDEDDGIEGMYQCPRCFNKIICEKTKDYDTRDFISDMDVKTLNSEDPSFEVKLNEPITIDIGKQEIISVSNMKIAYATLNHCSAAYLKVGETKLGTLQLAIYVESLQEYDGIVPDGKWKSRWGMKVMRHIDKKSLSKMSKKTTDYGYQTSVMKHCNKCDKDFEVHLNTSNFFGSALQPGEV